MEFSWEPTIHGKSGGLHARLDNGKYYRCGEVYPKHNGQDKWTYVLSLRIAPVNFVAEDHVFDTKQEAQEALQSIATVLIIGGNHERDRAKEL
jgi:hypothetical protein